MSGKHFYKEFKIGSLDVYVEGALTHHVIGLGSVEWGAGRARSYYREDVEGVAYKAPAYLNIDTSLPFSWFRVSIEKDNK